MKRLVLVIMVNILVIVSVVYAIADNGDNFGEDVFCANVSIANDSLCGDYIVGNRKEIKFSFFQSGEAAFRAKKYISIESNRKFSELEYFDGTNQVDEETFQTETTFNKNTSYQIKVNFDEEGWYTIKFWIENPKDNIYLGTYRTINVYDGKIVILSSGMLKKETDNEQETTIESEKHTETQFVTKVETSSMIEDTTKVETSSMIEDTTKFEKAIVNKTGRVRIKKIFPKKKLSMKLKVSLKKISKVSYQLKIFTSKKSAKNNKKPIVTVEFKSANKVIKSKKLKNKKRLYVKVRTYVFVSNKKVYGTWSKIKKVRIK